MGRPDGDNRADLWRLHRKAWQAELRDIERLGGRDKRVAARADILRACIKNADLAIAEEETWTQSSKTGSSS